jgi:transposase
MELTAQNLDRESLEARSPEELIELVLQGAARVKELEAQVKELEARLKELEARLNAPPKTSQNSSKPPSQEIKGKCEASGEKKKGPPFGHPGTSRSTPEEGEADVVIFERVEECPYCGTEIDSDSESYSSHWVYELPPLSVWRIEIRRQRTTCPHCQRTVSAPNPPGVRDRQVFGPQLELFVSLMHHRYHIPQERIQEFLREVLGEEVSDGAIENILARVSQQLEGEYDRLGEEIEEQAVVGVDETGWRVAGDNWWLWIFQNAEVSYYTIDEHRSSGVVKGVLGEAFGGTLVSDFYSAYGPVVAGSKQKCLAHLLRDIEYGVEVEAGVEDFSQTLKGIFQEAIRLGKRRKEWEEAQYQEEVQRLEERLDKVLGRKVQTGWNRKLQQRLLKHRKELFVFLYDPAVPATNNGSERGIRQLVIHRKISNGSRSEGGAKRIVILASVIETLRKGGGDWVGGLQRLLGFEGGWALARAP